jgi:hypothetical protein
MTETFFTYNATLMSPRTAKYLEAMIREGDSFNFDKWLERARQEEAEAKQAKSTGSPGDEAAADIEKPLSTPHQQTRPNSALQLMTNEIRLSKAPRRHSQPKSLTKAHLRRWREKVRVAWGEFQASRTRDAVYGYLEAVFAIVQRYTVHRRTTRLLRRAFEFADLPFDKNVNPFVVSYSLHERT